jgi:ABC-type amino acid transport system, permease component
MRFVLNGTTGGGSSRHTRTGRVDHSDHPGSRGGMRHTHPWQAGPSGIPGPRYWRRPVRFDLYNGTVMAKVYRSGIPSLGQGLWQAALGVGIMGSRILPGVVPRMTRPALTQPVTSLQEPTLGEVVSHPHAVRREHTLGSLQPVALPRAAVVTAPTARTGRVGVLGWTEPARWRRERLTSAGCAPAPIVARFDPTGLS